MKETITGASALICKDRGVPRQPVIIKDSLTVMVPVSTPGAVGSFKGIHFTLTELRERGGMSNVPESTLVRVAPGKAEIEGGTTPNRDQERSVD